MATAPDRRSLILLGAAAILSGCAAAPAAPTTQTKDSSPPIAAAPESPATPPAEPAKKFKPPPGYRLSKVGAELLWCKTEVVLGSRFPTKLCMTEDQLRDLERRNEGMRTDKQRAQGVCGGPGACGNGG